MSDWTLPLAVTHRVRKTLLSVSSNGMVCRRPATIRRDGFLRGYCLAGRPILNIRLAGPEATFRGRELAPKIGGMIELTHKRQLRDFGIDGCSRRPHYDAIKDAIVRVMLNHQLVYAAVWVDDEETCRVGFENCGSLACTVLTETSVTGPSNGGSP